MKTARLKSRDDFPELSYSNDSQPRLKRWVIRTVEGLSGRKRYAALYAVWRAEVQRGSRRCFSRLLELIDVEVRHKEARSARSCDFGQVEERCGNAAVVVDG